MRKRKPRSYLDLSCVRLCKSYSEVTSKVCHEEDATRSVKRESLLFSFIDCKYLEVISEKEEEEEEEEEERIYTGWFFGCVSLLANETDDRRS